MNPYLLLWLEAPMQSWGHDSRFSSRDSLDFPTKSGVLGLLCCARGVKDKQVEWLSEFAELDMRVDAFTRMDRNRKPYPTSPLSDFHMVGSGYNDNDPWQNLLIPKTNDGKNAVGGGSKMTYRRYLQDMAFAVALEMPSRHIDAVANALQAPVWDVYLGRKCCVPTEVIFQGVHANAEAAIAAGQQIADSKNRILTLRVSQGQSDDGEAITLNDVPIQFGTDKRYRDRWVTVRRVKASDD